MIALRFLLKGRGQTVLIVLGIAMGVAVQFFLASLIGGRVSEEEFFGRENITTGALSDLKRATLLARKMVVEYGMSEKLGPQTYGHKEEMPFLGREMTENRNYSEEIAALIDKEVSQFIAAGRKKADGIIKKHKSLIEKVAEKLLKEETMPEEEFIKIVGPKNKS